MPQVVNLQAELTYLQGHLSTMELPTPPTFAAENQMMPITATFCVSNLPSPPSNNIPATVDVSTTFFEPQMQSHWVSQQQHQLNQQQYVTVGDVTVGEGPGTSFGGSGATGGGDLQLLARELLDRHGTVAVGSQPEPPPCTQ